MAHTRTWDNTTPTGGSNLSAGDDAIRNFKVDTDERMQVDHEWATDTTVDGRHTKVTMLQAAAPTQIANYGILFVEDVSSKPELKFIDEDGDVVILTDGGLHALLGINNAWTKGQAVAEVTLTDAEPTTVDASLSNAFKWTIAGNRTLSVPTNGKSGQIVSIRIIQDATGSRTLTPNSSYKKVAGLDLTLSTTAAKEDLLIMYFDGTVWTIQSLNKDIKASV